MRLGRTVYKITEKPRKRQTRIMRISNFRIWICPGIKVQFATTTTTYSNPWARSVNTCYEHELPGLIFLFKREGGPMTVLNVTFLTVIMTVFNVITNNLNIYIYIKKYR